jgi:putative membrane protein insertion efficiency factor
MTMAREHIAARLLSGYKRLASPLFGTSCRYTPTCSEYAAEAVAVHGWLRGSALAAHRLLRCHPFAQGGLDAVPREHTVQTSQPVRTYSEFDRTHSSAGPV